MAYYILPTLLFYCDHILFLVQYSMYHSQFPVSHSKTISGFFKKRNRNCCFSLYCKLLCKKLSTDVIGLVCLHARALINTVERVRTA